MVETFLLVADSVVDSLLEEVALVAEEAAEASKETVRYSLFLIFDNTKKRSPRLRTMFLIQ